MSESSVSTRIASELLSVHESSIKRWCNAGELAYWSTPGGHRRIHIEQLVAFAGDHGIEASILDFGESAAAVWAGVEAATKQDDFEPLSTLVFDWIGTNRAFLLQHLIPFLVDHGIPSGVVFDSVVGTAMARIGSAYQSQELTIGDEHRMTHQVRDALIALRLDVPAERNTNGDFTAVVGCIRGGMHEIGALMIRSILEVNGWHVIYLGQDVPTEEFQEQAEKHGAKLICVSVTPLMGNAEAGEAVRLMDGLSNPKNSFRLAIGGTRLDPALAPSKLKSLKEVQYFLKTAPFEEWAQSLK